MLLGDYYSSTLKHIIACDKNNADTVVNNVNDVNNVNNVYILPMLMQAMHKNKEVD